jgi:hypothetical protein
MHKHICDWLGLPAESWPPDHYTLLGLARGETDPTIIERNVQDRMQRVRPFQLNYPDQVTEIMNRLAQAFDCLTNPAARKEYEDSMREASRRNPARPEVSENGSPDLAGPLAWLYGPWDRLAEEASGSPAPLPKLQLQNWNRGVRPPPRRKASRSGGSRDSADHAPSAKLEPGGTASPPLPSILWRYSNGVLVMLAMLALLLAFLRQWDR